MGAVTNMSSWTRVITVSASANRLSAWDVREFVKHLDAAGVPDSVLIDDHHSFDTRALTGLTARVTETLPEPEGA